MYYALTIISRREGTHTHFDAKTHTHTRAASSLANVCRYAGNACENKHA